MSGSLEYTTIFLFLTYLGLRLGKRWASYRYFLAVCLGLGALLIPCGELTAAQYILSYQPFFSFSSFALCFILLYKELTEKTLITRREILYLAHGNVILGITLYLSSFALLPVDIYFYGFFFSAWFFIVFMMNILCVFYHLNTLFYILLGCIVAFIFECNYSKNYFDYLLDPLLFFYCLGVILNNLILVLVRKKV